MMWVPTIEVRFVIVFRQVWNLPSKVGQFTSSPVSASPVLGLQAHATMCSFFFHVHFGDWTQVMLARQTLHRLSYHPALDIYFRVRRKPHNRDNLRVPYRNWAFATHNTSIRLCLDCTHREEGQRASPLPPPPHTLKHLNLLRKCGQHMIQEKDRDVEKNMKFLLNCFRLFKKISFLDKKHHL